MSDHRNHKRLLGADARFDQHVEMVMRMAAESSIGGHFITEKLIGRKVAC